MFSYADLLKEVDKFNAIGVETGVVPGDSTLSQRIPYIFVGKKTENCIIVQGAMHAREHITALLVLQQAKFLVKRSDLTINGGIYFIPMTNPDGVRLAQENLSWIENKKLKTKLVEINGGNTDFSLWKANIRGVDLNVNFDAKWARGKQNVFFPSPDNYVGKSPNSEKETINLIHFTESLKPLATLSYHTKGEVIYWRFTQDKRSLWRDYRLAKGISALTGYKLDDGVGSVGGYKDWCVDKLHIPAFTVEVGKDSFPHPYPYSEFENIFNINYDTPRRLLNSLVKDKEFVANRKQAVIDSQKTEKVDE